MDAFKVTIPRDIYVRIAAVSDGFPYYVHLVTEKILWAAWEDPKVVTSITWDHYRRGLKDAISSIDAELHRPYKLAVTQRTDDYEEVLWSTADGEFLHRFVDDMYYTSYLYIMKQREGRIALAMPKYRARIRALREPQKGSILIDEKGRNGLYRYRETMLRGYVRMQAESEGIELAGDKDPTLARQTVHIPASARRGYRTSQIPRGVHFSKPALSEVRISGTSIHNRRPPHVEGVDDDSEESKKHG